jgi:protein-S-isoprenylcysteine O-methyltransferase Ste14
VLKVGSSAVPKWQNVVSEFISEGFFLMAAIGCIAVGSGFLTYLRHHGFVAIYLVLFGTFDALDRLVRPPFDPNLNRDSTSACRLSSTLMLFLFAAAPWERVHLHGEGPAGIVSLLGVLLELAGLSIALGARVQLGRFGTPHLEVWDDQSIVRSGFYRYIRHPIYVGGIIGRQAWAIVWGSPIMLLVGAVFDVLLIAWRIRTEEVMMIEHFGDRYRSYMGETSRLIPGLW